MLVLLPPSETKRSGGEAVSLDWKSLAFPALTPARRTLSRALVALSRQPEAAMATLKLGRTQTAEIERNRVLLTSETMPAIDRYTGVVYDALDAASLSQTERFFAHEHVAIHSALFGPLAALDAIPAYRLSHDSRIPELALKKHWMTSIGAALAKTSGLVIDLRSEAYVALGAAPCREDSVFLRVVTDVGGSTRALNHFNKKAKGQFVRALVQHGHIFATAAELLAWAPSAGIILRPGAGGTRTCGGRERSRAAIHDHDAQRPAGVCLRVTPVAYHGDVNVARV
ncbi:YaaA family protein [Cryobacterium sp. MLB-32]|uniref:YaaA family protein n=1 Tax=Cryobacterium sp. MLB-32 TaxID=1529318 RepID=UPI001E5E6F80|nr:peroxide stress protein YaaA [Cryobacterium sp. MLB-32]